jgi:hypothetical protein
MHGFWVCYWCFFYDFWFNFKGLMVVGGLILFLLNIVGGSGAGFSNHSPD